MGLTHKLIPIFYSLRLYDRTMKLRPIEIQSRSFELLVRSLINKMVSMICLVESMVLRQNFKPPYVAISDWFPHPRQNGFLLPWSTGLGLLQSRGSLRARKLPTTPCELACPWTLFSPMLVGSACLYSPTLHAVLSFLLCMPPSDEQITSTFERERFKILLLTRLKSLLSVDLSGYVHVYLCH